MKDKPMKVCMLTTSFPRWKGDFAASFVHDLCTKLVENGVKVMVVAPHDIGLSRYEVFDGIEIYRFQYIWPKKLQRLAYHGGIPHNLRTNFISKVLFPFFLLSFTLKGLKVAKGSDIIHAQWLLSGFVGAVIKKFSKKPVIMSILGSGAYILLSNPQLNKKPLKLILNEIDLIIAPFLHNKKEMTELGFESGKITVIPMGVDSKIFTPDARSQTLRKTLNAERDYIIINTCVFTKNYHVEVLIEAIPLVLKEIQNVKFILANSGPLQKELEDLVCRLGIEDHVIFIGGVPHKDMPKFFAISDVYVETSYQPSSKMNVGIGQATREAMASGVPQLLPDYVLTLPGIEEHALCYRSIDSKDLADKLLQLLEDENLRKELGKKSRQKIIEIYDIDIVIKRLEEMYNSLLQK